MCMARVAITRQYVIVLQALSRVNNKYRPPIPLRDTAIAYRDYSYRYIQVNLIGMY